MNAKQSNTNNRGGNAPSAARRRRQRRDRARDLRDASRDVSRAVREFEQLDVAEHVGDDERQAARAYIKQRKERLGEYVMSLLNPFGVRGARIPGVLPTPTATFSVTQSYTLRPGTSSHADELYFVVKGGLFGFFGATATTIQAGESFLTGGGGNPMPQVGDPLLRDNSTAGAPLNTVVGQSVYALAPVPECESIIETFSAYRKVSGGMKIMYTGPRLNATGTKVCALIPGSQQLPFWTDPTIPATVNHMIPSLLAIDYDTLRSLEGALEYPSQEETTMIWRPQSDAIEEWRPCRYVPTNYYFDNAANFGDEGPPPCDSAPADYTASVDGQIAALQAAGWSTLDPWMRRSYCMTDPADPIMACGFRSLQADSSFVVEVTFNYEAIPDNRTWSLAQAATHYSSSRHAEAARMVASMTPHSHSGSHDEWLVKAGKKLAQAWGMAKQVVGGARKLAPIAGSVASELGFDNVAAGIADAAGVQSVADLAALLI